MDFSFTQQIIIWILPVLFAVTVHEVAHGFVASKLGDQTARMLGRLTINPLKHVDLLGTIILPILLLAVSGGQLVFGWAKPVPINPRNFKHLRRDLALVSIAGPAANLFMAVVWALIMKLGLWLVNIHIGLGMPLMLMCAAGIRINLVLCVLNLIPIPPLDGGHFLINVLPSKWGYYYSKLERYGLLIILLLLITGLIRFILYPPVALLYILFTKLFGL